MNTKMPHIQTKNVKNDAYVNINATYVNKNAAHGNENAMDLYKNAGHANKNSAHLSIAAQVNKSALHEKKC